MTVTPSQPDPTAWAKAEVDRLRLLHPGDKTTVGDLVPTATYLSRYAGPSSTFATQAHKLLESRSPWSEGGPMADLLQGWLAWKEAGMHEDAPFEVRARVEAANDLMDQVTLLLADASIHPAAPIVLTGAALEERLRALMLENNLTPSGKPGLDTYGADLKRASVIDGQESKQVTAWAGLRNRAAHGQDLDKLTVEEARIMSDGVNLFLLKHSLAN